MAEPTVVTNAAFDASAEAGVSPSAAAHKERIAAASNRGAPTDELRRQNSTSQPPSRNSASMHGAPNYLARSRSPPHTGAYMMSTADGTTVPMPQPSSQRSMRSERPTASDAGDLREYSPANAVPIAAASQALRWRSGGSGMHPTGTHPGSPTRSSIPSRRGGGLHRVSHSNASFCGSVDSRSTYAAGWVGAPPVPRTESVYTADGRPSLDHSRQLGNGSQHGATAGSPLPPPQAAPDAPQMQGTVPPPASSAVMAKVLDSADVVSGSKSISFGVTKLQQVSTGGPGSVGVVPRAGPSSRSQHSARAAAPAGGNSPLPGSAAQLMKADVKPVSVRGSAGGESTSGHGRKPGPSEDKAAQYAAIHAAREQGSWKHARF